MNFIATLDLSLINGAYLIRVTNHKIANHVQWIDFLYIEKNKIITGLTKVGKVTLPLR